MKKLFAAILIMSMVMSSLPAFAGTDDDNNGPEIEPVYFGFTFDLCTEKKPCEYEKDSVADGESDEEPKQEDEKK